MPLPSVTVVIPTRDRPEMLREALAAVHAQDYEGSITTIVVQDGGGPLIDVDPGTPDRAVLVTANKRSPGLAGSRNTGIELTETPFVAFCDDDDIWLPTKLSRQVAAMTEAPGAVLASCWIRVRNVSSGTMTERSTETTEVSFRDLLRDRHVELHSSTFLLRTDALRGELGLVDEAVPGGFGEDYDLLLRAARIAPILVAPEALTEVRWHGGSFFFERWAMMRQGLTWLLERYPEFASEPAGYARIAGQIAIAAAAQGDRRGAMSWAKRAARKNPAERRVPIAIAVALGVVSAESVMAFQNKRGKGI